MSTKYDNIKDTYCYYAFQGFSTHSHGRARPCCISRMETVTYMPTVNLASVPHVNHQTANNIDEFMNDSAILELRKAMLEGVKSKDCARCWNLEDAGIKSFRQINNEIYEEHIIKDLSNVDETGHLDTKTITYLDISLGNVCNLKCRSCNPWNSHRWIEEGPHVPHTGWDETAYDTARLSSETPWYLHAFETNFFDEVLPNIKTINFLGGEPLVVKEHYTWLEHIIKNDWAKNIELFYNTNATTIPKRLLDIWTKFKNVNLSLSLDAKDDLAYYVRYPSEWKQIEKNVNKLKEYIKKYDSFTVHVHVTVSVLNIHDLPNILNWCLDQYREWNYYSEKSMKNYGYHNAIPHINIVEYPSFLHVRQLPDEIKTKVNDILEIEYQKYKSLTDIPDWEDGHIETIGNLKNLVNLERDPVLWEHFINNTKASDKFRKVNIKDYIEWMKDYI